MVQKKKTAAELKNELYIASLIEEHCKDNVWLTKTFKDRAETERSEFAEQVKQNPSLTVDEALKWYEEDVNPYYKEQDILLYLFLRHSISHVESSKLNEEEVSFAKKLIIADFQYSSDDIALAISVIINRLKYWYRRPNLNHEFIIKSIEEKCSKGIGCFEPFSHFLDYSDTLAYSMEELVIYKSMQSCMIATMTEEELKDHFFIGWSSDDYPGLSVEEIKKIVDAKEKENVSNFVNTSKVRLVTSSDNNKQDSIESIIWQSKNKEYNNILIPIDAYGSHIDLFDIDFYMEHVVKGGLVIIFGSSKGKDLEDFQNDTTYLEVKEKITKRPELSTYFAKPKFGGVEVFILQKGKTHGKVNVFYHYDSSRLSALDIKLGGMLNQIELTAEDLIALDYDMSKLEWIPTPHAVEGEYYGCLADFLSASQDVYVRRNQTAVGKVFSPDNYATSFDTFIVPLESLREAEVDDKWKKVSEPVLVIRQKPFSVAYVEASDNQPVYFKNMAKTFSVKKNVVDPKYLYLLSTNGKLEQLVNGGDYYEDDSRLLYIDERNVHHIGYCPAKDLLCYKGLIAIPSLSVQKEQSEMAEKAERNRIERAVMSQYRQDIRERKHALGQIMCQLRSSWDALVLAKEGNHGLIDDKYVYGRKNPHTVKYIFESINAYIEELGIGIETFTPEEDIRYQEKEPINIKDYIDEYTKKHPNLNYEFEILSNPSTIDKGVFVFSRRALDKIFQNIIFNAWKHGFKGRTQGNVIRISWCEDEESVQVFISNNGSPLDNSINNDNIFKFGKTTSRGQELEDGHHHQGLGCHEVWCLMRDKGQGDIQCISEKDSEFPVTFKLTFNK